MKRIARFGAIATLAVLAGALLFGSAASAHERRNVGPFSFVVGWVNEPALLNQPNSVDLRITTTADSQPVIGAEKTLKVEIQADGQKLAADLTPRFNTPGAYNANITPTKAGAFTFVFTGNINGTTINETFKAGQGTFGLIEEPKAFPTSLPAIQDVAKSVDALREGSATSSGSKDSSSSSGDTAMIIAIVSLIVGGAGLATGVYGLSKRSA
jgi:hypothetical protein